MNILIIDDDLSFCRMLTLTIKTEHTEDEVCQLHDRGEVESKLAQLGSVDVAIIDDNFYGERIGEKLEQIVKKVCHCLTIGTTWYGGPEYGDMFIRKDNYKKILEVIEEERRRKLLPKPWVVFLKAFFNKKGR